MADELLIFYFYSFLFFFGGCEPLHKIFVTKEKKKLISWFRVESHEHGKKDGRGVRTGIRSVRTTLGLGIDQIRE